MLADLTQENLEVWGFDGVPSVVCSTSLPIVRHKPSDRFCALSVARRGGPAWSSRSEIEEYLREGRVTRLTTPLVLPEALFPLTPAGQPLVAWAKPEFWLVVLRTDDESDISFGTRFFGWKSQTVERTGIYAVGRTRTLNSPLWVVCNSKIQVEGNLDSLASKCLKCFDRTLVTASPDWYALEELADCGLCAARTAGIRYPLYVRYGTAMYYAGEVPGSLERCTQLFRVLVKNEFPTVDWERFRTDMAAVVDRSRDLLRFEVETASIQAMGERIVQRS